MRHLINKDAVVAEIEKELNTTKKYSTEYVNGKKYALKKILSFIDILEAKEINNVWHDTRRTIPEDGSEQIICIKEDGLAVSTSGKIVNGTIKWAYLGDLLNINSFNVEVKEVDFKKEFDNYAKDILACDVQFQPFTHLYNCAKYFYELGLKAQKRE